MDDCERQANWIYSKRYFIADKNGHPVWKCTELAEKAREEFLKECEEENNDQEDTYNTTTYSGTFC